MNWNEVLNTSFIRWKDGMIGARECALLAGYPYFSWNGTIYKTQEMTQTTYIVGANDKIVINYYQSL
jgi:hypothetical protein